MTDDPVGVDIETFPLWDDHSTVPSPAGLHMPSCYRRMKLFDPATQRSLGIKAGSRVVWLDLDMVGVAGAIPIFEAYPDAPFVGWSGISPTHGRIVYNGTLVMIRAGDPFVQSLWTSFDPEVSPVTAARANYYGSDQGYLSWKLNGMVPGVDVAEGMFSFNRDVLVLGEKHPPVGARIISFNGKGKPWDPEVRARHPWLDRFYPVSETSSPKSD